MMPVIPCPWLLALWAEAAKDEGVAGQNCEAGRTLAEKVSRVLEMAPVLQRLRIEASFYIRGVFSFLGP